MVTYLHMMFDYEQYLSCDWFSILSLPFANKWGKVPAVYVIPIYLDFPVFFLSLLELSIFKLIITLPNGL